MAMKGIFNYFRSPRQGSAKVAKERLQVIVARERSHRSGPDYLPALHRELLEVIRKYVQVGDEAVQMSLENQGDCEILEVNITLSEPERQG
ncbi:MULTISPECIES: cell division topological specificity factor MinE [Ectothiorhodospira]|uniref:cell division topological specificity factor MinE n=1 Tax=Ectothiorhodospira TaxID=1051 RepID=UPI00024A893E|nr:MULTISPECIES: cell division topological specificity factor MinE [Ectothiorhodospira]EHQ53032.1 cell division topological specificity factor MinE [Ectothiorhodospira sp. PHS-1]MCG5514020.1 cell division topological specificity factor MinE [Ectothiorhodospira shaposhnikovii]